MSWELPQKARCSAQLRGCQGRGTWQGDPFDREIHERVLYRYLCEHCAQELADDI